MRKWVRRVWIAAGLLFVAVLVWNMQARGVDPATLESSATVRVVESGDAIRFLPAREAPGAGLIFLPGGGIDPYAYAPLLRLVAEAGHATTLVKVPWRLAPTSGMRSELWSRINGVLHSGGGTPSWVLAGHSRGAVFAVTYASEHAADIAGLALIGTTHPRDINLSESRLSILKIYATEDCVANVARVKGNSHLVPTSTEWVRIEGGNHRQFGYYGYQLGDCTATISRESQQAQTAKALIGFLARTGRISR